MRTEGRLLLAALFVTVLLYCATPVYSENIFWHLRNGEDILGSLTIRLEDPFTWTMRGCEWIQQEWLAEVLFAVGWRAGGPLGLTLVKTITVLSAVGFAVGAALRRRAAPSAVALVAVLWLSAAQARWFERPHIFTDLFVALYLFLLSGRPSLRRSLALFIPLQILWVNTHAGFLLGVFLLSLPAADLLSERRIREAAGWLLVPASALLASGVHPNGFRSILYLPGFLSEPVFRQSIREWWSPFDPRFGSALLPVILVTLTLGGIVLVAAGLRTGRRLPPSSLLLLAALTISSMFAARNAEILALASIATIPMLLAGPDWRIPASLICAAALVPPLFGLPREFGPNREFGLGMEWSIYPVGLADFIEENGLYGRVFNTNEISGYLEYRFGERLPLYMDGRCLLYPERFYSEYLLLSQAPDSLSASLQLSILERSGIEIALYDWPEQTGSTANLLAEHPGWAPVYWDRLTVAYARLDYLDRAGLRSLSTGAADPLSSEDLLSRRLFMIDQGMMPGIRTASSMDGWDAPAVIAGCVAWRAGEHDEARAMALRVRDPGTRAEFLGILEGVDSCLAYDPDSWPQLNTLRVWRAVSDARYPDAARLAEEMGDEQLSSSVRVLAGAGGQQPPGPPPPWVPVEAWSEFELGGSGPGESLAVNASAAFDAGDMSLAVVCARGGDGTVPFPGRPWSLATRAVVLASSGLPAEASVLADSALSMSRNPFTLLAAGRVQRMAGNPDAASGLFAAACSMAPLSQDASIELASSLWEAGDLAGAAAEYSRAVSIGAVLPPSGIVRMGWAAVLLDPAGS